VPQKIRVFAWCLATDSLAESLHRCIPRIMPICSICGSENEDAHHSMVRCTLARALSDGMRSVWMLPTEEAFRYTGRNWFLLLLDGATTAMRVKLLFLLWRTWHHRNNAVHGDGKASIAASVPFLQSYVDSLQPGTSAPDPKGKSAIVANSPAPVMETQAPSNWLAPGPGWI
jgi:hypothetical protein